MVVTDIVSVLPPIDTSNLEASDVDQLVKYTRDKMLRALELLTNSARGQQAFLAVPPKLEPRYIEEPVTEEVTAEVETVKDSEVKEGDLRKRVAPKTDDLDNSIPAGT